MNQEERQLYLIKELQKEMPQYQDIPIPRGGEEQWQLLRSLFNVRPPYPAKAESLLVQDEYLSEKIRQRGITDSASLPPVKADERICLWRGDITSLRCDAIVNAANSALLGCWQPCHSCIDNIIHSLSGIQLRLKCNEIMQAQGHEEEVGNAKLTPGYNLPCNYVLHTVGPIISGALRKRDCELLADCYRSCLELAAANGIRSIAFCCISTGVFHFPQEKAAGIAVETVTRFLETEHSIRRVIFNVFTERDLAIYRELLERVKGKQMVLCAAAALSAVMTGCAGTPKETEAEAAAGEAEEDYMTGDVSLDHVKNQDGIGENELLVISFGTSFNDSRRLTIGAIERAIEEAFPDYSVRRGFTSQIIIDRVKSRDKIAIDNVPEALDRAVRNGVKNLVIQPTHLMDGLEYTGLVNEAAEYSDVFGKVAIGEPLLTSAEDFKAVIKVITEATAEYDDGKTAVCFMGHGTEADSNQVYTKLQEMLSEAGYRNYYIGTVEAAPTVEDVLAAVKKGGYKKVVLRPLMIVAGDHAVNDMAGDEKGSWKTIFEDAGYEVTCLVQGLGELEGIRQIFVEHAQAAADSLNQ